MAKTTNLEVLPKHSIKRYEFNPNFIHNPGMCEVIIHDDSSDIYDTPSCTDKEAYRVTLASMRSYLKSSLGSPNVGSYSLKDGKYNPDYDFSYLNRKDLTIVDITNYIDRMKSYLENSDNDLKVRIQEELDKASALIEVKEKETVKETSSSE